MTAALSWFTDPVPLPGARRVALAPGVWLVRRPQPDVPEPRQRAFPHPGWMQRAACRGHRDADVLFLGDPADHPTLSPTTIERARAVCRGCPVLRECFEWALVSPHEQSDGFVNLGEDFGIWAGTTGRQRAKFKARLRRGAKVEELMAECLPG